MSTQTIDARGQACPKPVLMTREALQAGGTQTLRVIIDNMASCENVTRMVASMGYTARIDRQAEGEIHLVVEASSPGEAHETPQGSAEPAAACAPGSRNIVLISTERFGEGDDELGTVLMRAFVKTLKEIVPTPVAVFFLNAGVRLTTAGSPLLADLRELESTGVQIYSCGTCLDYFHLQESLEVGRVTNMFEVVSQLSAADRVIRP